MEEELYLHSVAKLANYVAMPEFDMVALLTNKIGKVLQMIPLAFQSVHR